MDEQLSDEIDLAGGYSLAAISLSTALMTMLVTRGVLSPLEASETFEASLKILDVGMIKSPENAVVIAKATLRGAAETWSKPDKRN
jgi:hypothetical protein